MDASQAPVRAALRRRSIRRTTLGFAAITLGEWVLGTSLAIHAYSLGGALAVGLVGARFVPASVASVLLSHLADRRAARSVLAAVGGLRAAAAGAALVAVLLDAPVWVLVAAVWLDAAIGAGYRPAQARLLPGVARSPAELTAATTLASMAKSAGQIVGAFAGSLLLVVVGAAGAVAVAGGLFLLSALSTAGIRSGGARAPKEAAPVPPLRRFRLGVEAIRRAPGARQIAAWSGARSLLRGVWTSLGVLASLTLLGMGQGGYGVLMAAAGAGTLAGIVLSGQLVGRRHLAAPLAVSLGIAGLSVSLVGVSGIPAVATASMVAWGAGMAVADVAAQSLLARVVTPSESARVVGVMEGGKLLCEGLGALLAPALAELVGVQETLIGAGALLVLAMLLDLPGFASVDRVAQGRVDLLELARGVPLFRSLRMDGLEAVVAPMLVVPVKAGEVIIEQDTFGSRWYLARTGRYDVLVDGFRTGSMEAGRAFGERGLMRGEARTATVRASTDGELLALERVDFLRALTGEDGLDSVAVASQPLDPFEAVRQQPLLHPLGDSEVHDLVAASHPFVVSPGTTLFGQGDHDDRWLLILDGKVEIEIDGVVRRQLGRGDALGEIAVLHRVARTGSARTLSATRILAIPGSTLRAAVRLLPEDSSADALAPVNSA